MRECGPDDEAGDATDVAEGRRDMLDHPVYDTQTRECIRCEAGDEVYVQDRRQMNTDTLRAVPMHWRAHEMLTNRASTTLAKLGRPWPLQLYMVHVAPRAARLTAGD